MVNRDLNPSEQNMYNGTNEDHNDMHFNQTTAPPNAGNEVRADFSDNHQTSYLPVLANENNMLIYTFTYQNGVHRYIGQRLSLGNNNAPVGTGSYSFGQQIHASFGHPQNNVTNDMLSQPFYNGNMTSNSLLQLLPPRQSTSSDAFDQSAPILLESGEGMTGLSSNKQSNGNTYPPQVFSLNVFPSNSQVDALPAENFHQDQSDPQIGDYFMTQGNGMNNNTNNNDNNANQSNTNDDFNTPYPNTNRFGGTDYRGNTTQYNGTSHHHGNISQFTPYSHYVNRTHAMDNAPSSSNSINISQNDMSLHKNGNNFEHYNYPSSSTMGSMPPNNIPNTYCMTPNDEYGASGSNVKSKGKGKVKCNKEKYICDICNKEINRMQDLIRHSRRHNGSRPFECEECHFKFARKDALGRHEKSSNGCKKHKKN